MKVAFYFDTPSLSDAVKEPEYKSLAISPQVGDKLPEVCNQVMHDVLSEFEGVNVLPENFKSSLPTIEEIESQLSGK